MLEPNAIGKRNAAAEAEAEWGNPHEAPRLHVAMMVLVHVGVVLFWVMHFGMVLLPRVVLIVVMTMMMKPRCEGGACKHHRQQRHCKQFLHGRNGSTRRFSGRSESSRNVSRWTTHRQGCSGDVRKMPVRQAWFRQLGPAWTGVH
jgi:hypothetical protein